MFLKDKYLPNAIILEYIPGMKELHWANVTQGKLDNFARIVKDIHAAGVFHHDLKPRNMMTLGSKADPDRVLLIDFDRAQTYNTRRCLTDHQREGMEEEEGLIEDIGDRMVYTYLFRLIITDSFQKADAEAGEYDRTLQLYY